MKNKTLLLLAVLVVLFWTAAFATNDFYVIPVRSGALEARIGHLEELLANVTRVGNDLTFSGINVHIVNGTGTTDGAVNGLGNLIVGYNEPRGSGNDRTGSHTIVVGAYQNYSSYGGLVAGGWNTVSGPYASVSGGAGNQASGLYSSVSGGHFNKASEYVSSVSGGEYNTASGEFSSVSGGEYNRASGWYSSVSGGRDNTASEMYSSVSGGRDNTASGWYSSVGGGRNNNASGDFSFVGGGGHENPVYGNEAYSHYSAVLGGVANVAGDGVDHDNAQQATVSGGNANKASGPVSSVNGGRDNTASGWYSTVSGGRNRSVSGTDDWRAGELFQEK